MAPVASGRRMIMRLIDADALIEEALTEGAYGYVDAKQIADAPTIDAVEVVRCKDCGHGERGADNIVRCNHPSGKRIMMTAYGFCNYGQRREDG